MNNESKFEVWGNWDDDIDCDIDYEKIQDCFTYEEAMTAVREHTATGRTAFIVDKETGDYVDG